MFEVISERINTSRPQVRDAVAARNAGYIIDDVQKQQEAGAHVIDVNAGARIGHEAADMRWLIETIQPVAKVPLALDSPDPAVLDMAFSMVAEPPVINSISLETEKFNAMVPVLAGRKCRVIALCMSDQGMPGSAGEILDRAGRLVQELNNIGIPHENIYVDPLVQSVATDSGKGLMVLDAVRAIRSEFPHVHITGGLSNISFGLPLRHMINRSFLLLMMAAGMDSAIIDPLDRQIMASIRTAEMLLGHDPFCAGYLKGVRSGAIT